MTLPGWVGVGEPRERLERLFKKRYNLPDPGVHHTEKRMLKPGQPGHPQPRRALHLAGNNAELGEISSFPLQGVKTANENYGYSPKTRAQRQQNYPARNQEMNQDHCWRRWRYALP